MNYTSNQVEAVLNEIGVEIISETDTHILCLCPYHRNTDTPAFSINKNIGRFNCFAPHCDEQGDLLKLVRDITKANPFVGKRLIERCRDVEVSAKQYIDDLMKSKEQPLPTFSQDILNRLADDFWGSDGQQYMNGRGFDDKTLASFAVGYSRSKQMVTIPMHDTEGNPVGIVGRSIFGKRFKNSWNMPTRRIPFNVHRAKKYAGPVIIVESSMDAIRIHQAGYPCVIATNGSTFSEHHVEIINKYWNSVVIMTDFDDPKDHRDPNCKKCSNTCLGHNPGRALGEKISKALIGKKISWASYDYGIIYPHDAKDAGDLTIEEIYTCIKNAVSDIEYVLWKKKFPLLAQV